MGHRDLEAPMLGAQQWQGQVAGSTADQISRESARIDRSLTSLDVAEFTPSRAVWLAMDAGRYDLIGALIKAGRALYCTRCAEFSVCGDITSPEIEDAGLALYLRLIGGAQ